MNLCEDQGFEHRHILRSRMPGEKLPPISTYDLLNGAYHEIRCEISKAPSKARILSEDAKKRLVDGALKSNIARRAGIEARQAEHFETIKRLLLEKAQDRKIMEETGLTQSELNRDIREQKELFDIFKERPGINYYTAKSCEAKFLENREAIYEALKTKSINAVAAEWKFGQNSLRSRLKREGWNGSV